MAAEIKSDKVDKVISLCVRRGILFPNSEIYGSFAGFFDYGPVGVELKRNVEASWWKRFVQEREDVVGMDGAIITHPAVWKASGHVDAFADLLVECTKCKGRYRADHLLESVLGVQVDGLPPEKIKADMEEKKIVCPKCKGSLAPARAFNLMFKTFVGAAEDESSQAFLRPETAQLIFADFKAVMLASRKVPPFGIAQVGKSFRNEISPRNFVFRCREFSQMEVEYFVPPRLLDSCRYFEAAKGKKIQVLTAADQEKNAPQSKTTAGDARDKKIIGTQWHAYWLAECVDWFEGIGIAPENLRLRQHTKSELSHYSSETWDVEYLYPWGWKELTGVANRGDFDLKQHSKFSGKDLSYFDQETKQKLVPHVIEPSFGVERAVFTLLLEAFEEKKEKGTDGKEEVKTVLRLHPAIAPVKAGVFPLMKKDGLAEKAREVFEMLRGDFVCEYDEGGSVGKRYARMDEIGTPYCVTVDYDSLEKNDVTVRDRDSAKQVRVPIAKLPNVLSALLGGTLAFEKAGAAVK
ncbi:MAG: glycine--tRNA ligase [Candidatus Micrarchaeota archaeon]|nr:glycine--tRNA ligase [Candidatus Micrarchaeota archaeon]